MLNYVKVNKTISAFLDGGFVAVGLYRLPDKTLPVFRYLKPSNLLVKLRGLGGEEFKTGLLRKYVVSQSV
ncbi:hypothetical protein WCT96_04650 [Pectobacterium carotovorum]|uniref:hypothetical protein n=1 Tax=Pectobacterium carotovorum TaxID=554 RepID=UPI0030166D01